MVFSPVRGVEMIARPTGQVKIANNQSPERAIRYRIIRSLPRWGGLSSYCPYRALGKRRFIVTKTIVKIDSYK